MFVIIYFFSPVSLVVSTSRVDEHLRQIVAAVGADSVRKQLEKIEALIVKDDASRKYAIISLQDYLDGSFDASGNEAREKRRYVIESMKRLSKGVLAPYLTGNIMVKSDLVGADLSDSNLSGVDFSGSFLIQSSLRNSKLDGASFRGAFIRNVNFTGASTVDLNLNEADWFNSIGLEIAQLKSAATGSVIKCPKDTSSAEKFAGFHAYLDKRYVYKFADWSRSVQQQLIDSWARYLAPGGLCEFAETLQAERKGRPTNKDRADSWDTILNSS